MDRLDPFFAVAVPAEHEDDVFSLEFSNPWDAKAARRAAELGSSGDKRPSIGRRVLARGLAAVSRGSAVAARRLDDGVAASRATAQ